MAYNRFAAYQIACISCGSTTSKHYAKLHNGQCKCCVTGASNSKRLYVCPDCGERRLTAYQKAHHYHCDVCTRIVEHGY